MKEIAKLLKSIGPNYELKWRMEYFGPDKAMVMSLVYWNSRLETKFTDEHRFPFDTMENFDQYGPQILFDMYRRIDEKLREKWGSIT